jgi:ribosomal protein S12 methylthiotransferase accessory factor
MGITRVANVTGLDHIGIPVVMVCRPNSRSLAVSQGKGLTMEAAKASGIMESIEMYHAENVLLPLKLASYAALRRAHNVVDADLLGKPFVSAFHPDRPLLWIEGQDWLRQEPAWAPFQLVHTAYTVDMEFDLDSFFPSSRGLASGNTLLEAVSHGLCEVVERDAGTLASAAGDEELAARRLDLGTVEDPDCRSILCLYERAGVAVAVWETTQDIPIPSFRCLIVDRERDPIRGLYAARGSGCHPVREIALLRALTEAAQSRLTAIAGSRDDCSRGEYRQIRDPEILARHRETAALGGTRNFSSTPTFESDTFDEDVAWELDMLRQAGMASAIVFDLTMAEFGLPVVRVVIPGLESGEEPGECAPGPRLRRWLEARA